MPPTLRAPVHDPRDHTDVTTSLARLHSQFAASIRDFDAELVQRIRDGQISQRELAESDALRRAVGLHHQLSVQQTPFRTRRNPAP